MTLVTVELRTVSVPVFVCLSLHTFSGLPFGGQLHGIVWYSSV